MAARAAAVRRWLDYKPDAIKVFTDGWRYGANPDMTSMEEPTLKVIVEEAHARNVEVLTHTVTLAKAKLASRAAGALRNNGFPAKGIAVAGSPAAELVDLAGRERADIIVVGSRSGRNAQDYFMGSVADTVVKHAPCTVFVYRE